jgi:hypothetical protein
MKNYAIVQGISLVRFIADWLGQVFVFDTGVVSFQAFIISAILSVPGPVH